MDPLSVRRERERKKERERERDSLLYPVRNTRYLFSRLANPRERIERKDKTFERNER